MQGVPDREIDQQQTRQAWITFILQQENLFMLAHFLRWDKRLFSVMVEKFMSAFLWGDLY